MKLMYLPFSLYLRVQYNSAKWSFMLHLLTALLCTFEASINMATNHRRTLMLILTLLIWYWLRSAHSNQTSAPFLNLVLIMKMLSHPNIVNLVEVIDDPTIDNFYMVL